MGEIAPDLPYMAGKARATETTKMDTDGPCRRNGTELRCSNRGNEAIPEVRGMRNPVSSS